MTDETNTPRAGDAEDSDDIQANANPPGGDNDVPENEESVEPVVAPRRPPLAPLPPDEEEEADKISGRINRLSGEPAPDISPDDFARLQKAGSLNIDPRGRVRVNRRDESDPGVSLRKRRAWYG